MPNHIARTVSNFTGISTACNKVDYSALTAEQTETALVLLRLCMPTTGMQPIGFTPWLTGDWLPDSQRLKHTGLSSSVWPRKKKNTAKCHLNSAINYFWRQGAEKRKKKECALGWWRLCDWTRNNTSAMRVVWLNKKQHFCNEGCVIEKETTPRQWFWGINDIVPRVTVAGPVFTLTIWDANESEKGIWNTEEPKWV